MGVIAIRAQGVGKRFVRGATPAGSSLKEALYRRVRAQSGQIQPGQILASWVLHDVSATIFQGEVVGLLGANGAGKSTLLKLIGGVMRPTAGELGVRGQVGLLLQDGTGFHPDLTARENVLLRGALLGLSRRQVTDRLADIVAFADAQDVIDQPVKHLSTGMRMRLGWSVAVHAHPDIYLMDEVLSVVDAAFRNRCLDHIGAGRSRPRTVLIVSHDLSILESMCSRILWLDHGRVLADGDDVPGLLGRYRQSAGETVSVER